MNLRILLHTCYSYVKPKGCLVQYRFPFPNLRFLTQNHLALLKDRFLKKILLKRANTRRIFFTNLMAQIILLLQLKTILGFQDSEVWIQGNSTIWPVAKWIQLLPLKDISHGVFRLLWCTNDIVGLTYVTGFWVTSE